MKFSLLSALFFSGAVAQGVYDLDNLDEVARLQAEGLQLEGVGAEQNLKVASSSPTSAYSWIVDRDNCRGIVDITSGFIAPSSNDELSSDFGSEIFTVTAISEGDCTFQIAYAVPSDFVSFEDYKNVNGLVIDFPIQVGSEEVDVSAKIECDAEREDCGLKTEYGITKHVEGRFGLMVSQAWMRAFTTPGGLFVWLPQAITAKRAQQGSVMAAERFVWITKWWAQIAGWIFFPASIAVLITLIDEGFWYGDDDDRRLLAPKVSKHNNWWNNNNWWDDDDEGDYTYYSQIVGASIMMSLEIAGWVMFYVSYKDSLKYGEYLIQRNIKLAEGASDAGF